MRGANVTLAVILALRALNGPVQAAEPLEADCTCAAAFDQTVAGVEADYAGYLI